MTHISNPQGAFYGNPTTQAVHTAGGVSWGKLYFDASKSNAIYGNADTVSTPSIRTWFLIRYR